MGIIDKALQGGLPAGPQTQPAMNAGAPGEARASTAQPDDTDWQDPAQVRAKMDIAPELQAAYDKIVKAGLKMMFDPSMRRDTMDFINQSGGEPAKLAEGVMAVVVSLHEQSNGTLPPNLIIPSAVELMVHAAGVAKEGGMDITNELLAEAIAETVQQTLVKFGANPQAMQEMISGMDSGESAPGQQALQAPQAPPMQAPIDPMQQGVAP